MPNTTPLSTDSGTQKIRIEIDGKPEEDFNKTQQIFSQQNQENIHSPLSSGSAALGIVRGSVSLSSSTSKEGNQPPILPHLAPDRLEDQSLVNSQGPDLTFGRDPHSTAVETPTNTTMPLEDSKEELKSAAKSGVEHRQVDTHGMSESQGTNITTQIDVSPEAAITTPVNEKAAGGLTRTDN